ncbi:MAG: hypothetical protein ACTSU7_09920 [Candidatus Heimdallarchaeaceae archaeon]
MEEMILFSLLLIIIGAINLFFASRFLYDKKWAVKYIQTSPKAFLWRKMLGEKNAYKITKNLFAPLGLIIGLIITVLGLILIIMQYI